jgi:hypothetical protein
MKAAAMISFDDDRGRGQTGTRTNRTLAALAAELLTFTICDLPDVGDK